jgi:hypothetical protein
MQDRCALLRRAALLQSEAGKQPEQTRRRICKADSQLIVDLTDRQLFDEDEPEQETIPVRETFETAFESTEPFLIEG